MLPFMDFQTLYCRGPANRPSHRLGGVNAGFSNFSEGLPTEAKSEQWRERMKTKAFCRMKEWKLFPHLPLEEDFDALKQDARINTGKERHSLVISFVVSERGESFFHITSMSELTLSHPVGSPCGQGKVPQPWPVYGPVPELNSLSSRSTSEITSLHPTSCLHSLLKSVVIRKAAAVLVFSLVSQSLLFKYMAIDMINMFMAFKNGHTLLSQMLNVDVGNRLTVSGT